MSSEPRELPINPLPPVVWVLVLPIAALEIVFALGRISLAGGQAALGWRSEALQRFAFAPEILDWMLANRVWPPAEVVRIVTYPFVSGSVTQAIFVVVFILAMGKAVAEIFRPWAVIAVFLAAAVAGALAYAALPFPVRPLFGGYPAVYGLIGAFTYILWARLGPGAGSARYRAFTLIGMLLAIQLVFGAIFGADWTWVADLAGFAAGFGLSFVVSPGGWARAVAQFRRR